MSVINVKMYYGDGYPREGCQLVVDTLKEGFTVTVLAPPEIGIQMDGCGVLERHFALTAEGLAVFIAEWRAGGGELPPEPEAPCEVMQRPPYEVEERMSPCKKWPACTGCVDPRRKEITP